MRRDPFSISFAILSVTLLFNAAALAAGAVSNYSKAAKALQEECYPDVEMVFLRVTG